MTKSHMKTTTLSVRVEDYIVGALDKMAAETGIERANIVRALLIAADAFYKEHGYLQMPLRVVAGTRKPAAG